MQHSRFESIDSTCRAQAIDDLLCCYPIGPIDTERRESILIQREVLRDGAEGLMHVSGDHFLQLCARLPVLIQ